MSAKERMPAKHRRRLEVALCTLADYSYEIAQAGSGNISSELARVIQALRVLVDGEDFDA